MEIYLLYCNITQIHLVFMHTYIMINIKTRRISCELYILNILQLVYYVHSMYL